MNIASQFCSVACVVVLAGCVTPQPLVKDVLVDPQAYLASNFTEDHLSESVRSALGITAPGRVVRQVKMNVVMTNLDGDDKKESFDKEYVINVLDNGLTRQVLRGSKNGISSLSEFLLSYHGVFSLIYTSMSHSATNVASPHYVKAITRLDKGIADPKESTEYTFEYAVAPEVQIVNFQNQKTVCKTRSWAPGSTIHAKLKGKVLLVDCEYFGRNGENFLNLQNVFIKELGVTLPLESTTSTRKRVWTIKDVF